MFKDKKIKNIIFIAVSVLIVISCIGASYYFGFIKGNKTTRNIVVQGIGDPQKGELNDFSLFWEAWNTLKTKYVSVSSIENNQNLLYGAITGLVNSLKDPYTTFFTPDNAIKFNEDVKGEFGGMGAEIGLDSKNGNQLVIIAPLDGTPAYKAGLKPKDKIIKINGEPTFGISVEDAVKKIRGEIGTKVVLTIHRDGWDAEKDFEIIRELIKVPTLKLEFVDFNGNITESGKIAYIKMENFYEQAPQLFHQAAIKALSINPKGLILDLRNNPGGYLDAAVEVGGWFVESGKIIAREEFQDESFNRIFKSIGPASFSNIPTVVIINKGSASASEILAGAIKENNGAVLIGEKSFGKGTVQELVALSDGSMVKITVAHWLTPNKNLIDKNGIEPDIKIEEESSTSTPDNLVKKAVEILAEKIK